MKEIIGIIIIMLLFLLFIIMLLKAENLDKKENEIIDEKPIEPFKRIGLYPTKCERCGKLDEYVTKPHQRFCNSCHLDYMMID